MRIKSNIIRVALLALITFAVACKNSGNENNNSKESGSTSTKTDNPSDSETKADLWSVKFADHIMQKWPDPTTISDKGFEYNNSIIFHGLEKVYKKTGDEKYFKYIKEWVDAFVDDEGNIKDLEPEADNLDKLHPGILLLFLYEETGEDKYKKAAKTIRNEFDNQPRNKAGGFWHKKKYEHEMWLDGIYMAQPFLVKYGKLFNDQEYAYNEATKQINLISEHTYNEETGLFYHGWDADKDASWADKETGLSDFYWSRGLGWFSMALVDILDTLPKSHKGYDDIHNILKKVAKGIKKHQDKESGLWYQVLDKGNRSDNWHETSGSAMFVYALKKGVDNDLLDESYLKVAKKGWKGVQTKMKMTDEGPVIFDAVEGMGIQDTYKDYISKDKLKNSTHGLCVALMASSQMEF